MGKNGDFSSLFGQLSAVKSDGTSVSRLLSPGKSSVSNTPAPSSKTLSPAASTDLRSQSLQTAGTVKSGINFGAPSSNKSVSSQGTSEWTNLLKQTVSGGVASALGGGLTSAIGGLGGLVSSIASLFGGGTKAEAPLQLFQLPNSQNETVSIRSSASGSGPTDAKTSGAYGSIQSSSVSASEGDHSLLPQYQSTQVAQAVKQALLNSSSLNDVIAEI
jgi:hypothetical protein